MNALLIAIILQGGALPPGNRPQKDPDALIRKWVVKNVAHQQGLDEELQPVAIADPELKRALPDRSFYSVHFREFPVRRMAPAPLTSRNLFVIEKDGTVRLFTTPEDLAKYAYKAMRAAKDVGQVKEDIVAWLRLSQEFSQDGFFHFSIPRSELKLDLAHGQASGKAVVEPKGGDRGAIAANLRFKHAPSGWVFTLVEEVRTVQAGVRPICQATKLLDPDPIIRRMAERDILVMGTSARAYLQEQRAYANPELQKAIDRIWARILRGER